MRKFLINTVLFIAFVIIADKSVGFLFEKKYLSNTCAFSNGEINLFLKSKTCDTLFIGSSRVLHMIDIQQFSDKTRSLSKQQKHIYYNAALIDILYQEKKLPKKMLVLNFETEDCFLSKEEELINEVSSLKYYYNKNAFVKKTINKMGLLERIKLLSSVYRFNGDGWKLLTYSDDACPNFEVQDYIPLKSDKNDGMRIKESIRIGKLAKNDISLNPEIFKIILRIQSICQKNGTDFVIITAPYYKYPKNLNRGHEKFQQFCQKNKIDYYNFNYYKIRELKSSGFWYDNLHTNDIGSKIYTTHLKQLLSQRNFK